MATTIILIVATLYVVTAMTIGFKLFKPLMNYADQHMPEEAKSCGKGPYIIAVFGVILVSPIMLLTLVPMHIRYAIDKMKLASIRRKLNALNKRYERIKEERKEIIEEFKKLEHELEEI